MSKRTPVIMWGRQRDFFVWPALSFFWPVRFPNEKNFFRFSGVIVHWLFFRVSVGMLRYPENVTDNGKR